MSDGLKITTRVTWNDTAVRERARQATSVGAKVGAEHLLRAANRTVPKDRGDLSRSGFVSVNETGEAVVGYDEPYAVKQHEAVLQHHGTGRRKWLELTAHEVSNEIAPAMAPAVKAALR